MRWVHNRQRCLNNQSKYKRECNLTHVDLICMSIKYQLLDHPSVADSIPHMLLVLPPLQHLQQAIDQLPIHFHNRSQLLDLPTQLRLVLRQLEVAEVLCGYRTSVNGRNRRRVRFVLWFVLGYMVGIRLTERRWWKRKFTWSFVIFSQTRLNSLPRTKLGSAISSKPNTSNGSVISRPKNDRGVISP